jgi:hypothetical protein
VPTIDDILPMPLSADTLPLPDPFYTVMGSNGPALMKKTLYGRALVPIKSIDYLPKITPLLWSDIPKVPTSILSEVWAFFRHVWETRHSEAMVYLTHKDDTYRVFVPRQEASVGHVNARLKAEHIAEGWMVAGTIHSHCNFGAFHSGTDEGDAEDHDGLHITIGHVDLDEPSIAGMVSINGVNWNLKYEEYAEAPLLPNTPFPPHWSRYVVGALEPAKTRPPLDLTPHATAMRLAGGAVTDDEDATARCHRMVYGNAEGIYSRRAYNASDVRERTTGIRADAERAIEIGDLLGFEDEMAVRSWATTMDEALTDLETELDSVGISTYISTWYTPTFSNKP